MGALSIAGHYIIPGRGPRNKVEDFVNDFVSVECCLYFNHTLYRGNRVSKMSSYDLSAFDSPNFPPLVKGENIYHPAESTLTNLLQSVLILL